MVYRDSDRNSKYIENESESNQAGAPVHTVEKTLEQRGQRKGSRYVGLGVPASPTCLPSNREAMQKFPCGVGGR